jgi:hypothetical protein
VIGMSYVVLCENGWDVFGPFGSRAEAHAWCDERREREPFAVWQIKRLLPFTHEWRGQTSVSETREPSL